MSSEPPWETAYVLEAMAQELSFVYADTDYPVPHFGEVVDEVLRTIADAVLDGIDDQESCNKVDECTARAIFLRAFAKWLRAEAAARTDRRAAMDELVRVSEEMGLYDDE